MIHRTEMLCAALGIASTATAGVAIARPAWLHRSRQRRDQYYALMYAARAVPLGVTLALQVSQGRPDSTLVWITAACQAGDAAIGLRERSWGQALSAGTAALFMTWLASTKRATD